jgi:hypothetical protein
VGFLGYFLLPGTPDIPNRLFIKESDLIIARKRLQKTGHATSGRFNWNTLKRVATSWQVWAFLLLDIFFWNGSINTSSGGYLLWLKSLKRYSPGRLNQLGSISPALGIFYVLFVCFSSDLLWGPAWAITVAHVWNSIGLIILIIWNVPESALWFAFFTTYSAVAMSSVLYGWVNTQLRYSPAERAFTLVLINTVSQSTTAWTPLLVFKTVEAPRFKKGYPFVLGNAICLMIFAHCISYWIKHRRYVHWPLHDACQSTLTLEQESSSGHRGDLSTACRFPRECGHSFGRRASCDSGAGPRKGDQGLMPDAGKLDMQLKCDFNFLQMPSIRGMHVKQTI